MVADVRTSWGDVQSASQDRYLVPLGNDHASIQDR